MLFSRNWLAEYVDLPADPQEIARRLTAAGLNVEGVELKGADVLFDIDVTTNRPDCMNHLGLAREAAVIFGNPLRRPPFVPDEASDKASDAASVAIEDFQGCPRFTARVIRGVKIGPSPAWLRERLESIGQRSINNVVDVTNFVLWETGQPLHAYDLAKLGGRQLVARRARFVRLLRGAHHGLGQLATVNRVRAIGKCRLDRRNAILAHVRGISDYLRRAGQRLRGVRQLHSIRLPWRGSGAG